MIRKLISVITRFFSLNWEERSNRSLVSVSWENKTYSICCLHGLGCASFWVELLSTPSQSLQEHSQAQSCILRDSGQRVDSCKMKAFEKEEGMES